LTQNSNRLAIQASAMPSPSMGVHRHMTAVSLAGSIQFPWVLLLTTRVKDSLMKVKIFGRSATPSGAG